MIHRDNRRIYEASSAFNQILHREGPVNLTVCDVDTMTLKFMGNRAALRMAEHKQPNQTMKPMQQAILGLVDQCIRHAAKDELFGLTPDSGVFEIRGQLAADRWGHRKVDFVGPQIITTLGGEPVLAPKTRFELWDWLCHGPHGRLRNERW
jgi:hypothetical protein